MRMSRRNLLALLLLLGVSAAAGLSLVDMPNPMREPASCGRPGVSTSVICDPDNVLSSEIKDVIEGRIIEIEEKSQLEFGIAVVQSMSVLESQIDTEAKRFAKSLHTTWGVGDKMSENGVVVFLAIEDRAVHISTGKGVKDKLTDLIELNIIEHMRPFLKKGNYGEAIESAVLEMDLVMQNKSIGPSFMEQYGVMILLGSIFGAFGLYIMYEKREEEKLRQGKLALEKLMNEVKSADDNKFQFDSCPICLEDFSLRRDPADMEHLPNSGPRDTDPLMETSGSSAYTSSSQYREVRNMIPGHASSPSASSSTDPKRPMTLHCGHAFCHSCLKEYLSKANRNTVCPICRANVDPDTPSASPIPPRPQQPSGTFPDPAQQHRPTGTGGGNTQDYSNPSCHNQQQQQHQQYPNRSYRRNHFHEMEILYRLSSMNRRYPRVVTDQSYHTMRTAIETGNTPAFVQAAESRTTEVARTLADIQKRREAARKGSKGSSRSSFGGGSSRGGGGGGGRW